MGVQQYGQTVVETAADSPEELAFLAAIMANQLDELPKLVYADWLEERGDPRGPFLRQFVEIARDQTAPLPFGMEFSLPWRQVVGVWSRATIRQLIADESLTGPLATRAESELMRHARPTLHMLSVPTAEGDLPHGATKFGGRADLPSGVEWPVSRGPSWHVAGIFCAQIRLSDLRLALVGRELPRRGLLSFFYCPVAAAPVLLSAEDGPFNRLDTPSDLFSDDDLVPAYEAFFPLPSGALKLIEGIDLPLPSYFLHRILSEEFAEENHDYFEDLVGTPPEFGHGVPHNQLLGYGCEVNGYPAPEEQHGVRRLATFGSDWNEPHRYFWGDSAQPFWFITEADLAAQRFDNVTWMVG